jgi:hypothetical protein
MAYLVARENSVAARKHATKIRGGLVFKSP